MKDLNLEHKTNVAIQITHVKCLDEKTDEVITLDCFGKLNQTECKNICKEHGLVYINKTTTTNQHEILTSELIKLV